MLIIAEEKTTYPPDGIIPNLDTEEKTYAAVVERIQPLLPEHGVEEVLGALVNWSASILRPARSFDTWAQAVQAATGYAGKDVKSTTESQRQRTQAADGNELTRLGTAVGSTGRTDDARIVQRDRSRKWANCGMAAFHIREQLGARGGAPVRRAKHLHGSGTGDALKGHLLTLPASADSVLLFDCQFPQVHNFLIEAHADGRRYLAQGYQGTYFAQWWLGADDGYSGTPTAEIVALRDRYGRGRPIGQADYGSLLDGLVAALAAGWEQTAARWPSLPFNPDPQEVDGIRRRAGSPTFLVEVYELTRPGVARAALDGAADVSLSQLAASQLVTD